ncbi:DinB family protein [Alteromonas sp. H39]|uniref:DinB family protein n=1 Tax=Alteromonas sp. H39 TaxID=3389876 RepID=UPI0039DF9123
MTLKTNFLLMADYNEWMNNSIYDAASQLSHRDLKKDTGAFFGSVLGTLNHILVADMIWLKRIAAHPNRLSSLQDIATRPVPQKLNTVMYQDIETLKRERDLLDIVIKQLVGELSDETLESSLAYVNTAGTVYQKCLGHIMLHFFNHQTHHRGQVTTLLSQLGVDVGVTDLLAIIPDVKLER